MKLKNLFNLCHPFNFFIFVSTIVFVSDWIKIPMKFPGTCIACNEKIEINEIGLWSKGVGVKHEKCIDIDKYCEEYEVPVNFTLIPKENSIFKIVESSDKIKELQSKITNLLEQNCTFKKIRLPQEGKSTYHNDVDFPVVTAYYNSEYDVWWSNGTSTEKFFKNIFGVSVPNWKPESGKNSYPVLSINFNKFGSLTTAGVFLEDSFGNYFMAINDQIDGNYDTHIDGLSLHKKKYVIQKFFLETNYNISIPESGRPIFIIAKIDKSFLKELTTFVKNIKKTKDYFLKYSENTQIKFFDVSRQQFVKITPTKINPNEISTYDLDVEYEQKSTELITTFMFEKNNDEKLIEFESNDSILQSKEIHSSTSVRNPELASRMKIKHNHTCQVCEIQTFTNKDGHYYTESHHIIPRSLGGPDKPSNILIVCANCHRKFDSGDESTLLETYSILKQKNIWTDFRTLRQSKAISENLFQKLNNL